MYIRNKKGLVDKVFVFSFSLIIIVFVGYLATKFIISFTGSAKEKEYIDFYNKIEKDYNSVYTTYGSEKIFQYYVNSKVKHICFISSNECIKELDTVLLNVKNYDYDSLKMIYESGNNIVLYGNDDILGSKKIGKFNEEGKCFCIIPKSGIFKLYFENQKNKIIILEN